MWPFSRGFPYSNLHDLNLDWIIEKIKELENAIDVNADTGKIDKVIKNGNTEVYKFVVDAQGIAMEDPLTGIRKPIITWSNKSISVDNANISSNAFISRASFTEAISSIFKTRDRYTTVDNDGNEVGCFEIKSSDRHIQFWSKVAGGEPEIYALPAPTTTGFFSRYDILTTKIRPTVRNATVMQDALTSGTIHLYNYLNIVTVVAFFSFTQLITGGTTLFTIPSEFAPPEDIIIPDVSDGKKYIVIERTGNAKIYWIDLHNLTFRGNATYIKM